MKTLESILEPEELKTFGRNLFRGHVDEVINFIETKNIDINSVFNEKRNETLLYQCIRGFEYGIDNIKLTKYFLDKGADPNIQSRDGSSALHYAIYDKNLDAIELMLNEHIEVNQKSSSGYSTFFAFLKYVYHEIAFKGIPIKNRCLAIVEEMLKRGADPDIKSSYDSTVRNSFLKEMGSVLALFEKYDKLAIPKQKAANLRPPSNLKYPEICKEIWSTYVPKSGAAETVVGELLRAIEKLRDEAQRNGNMNYDDWHKSIAIYIKDTLIDFNLFDEQTIKKDIKPLTYKTRPYLEDDIYDRFCDRIAEVYIKFPEPIYRNK